MLAPRPILLALLPALLLPLPMSQAEEEGAAASAYRAGLELVSKGDLAAAEKTLRAALEIDPDRPEIHHALGVAALGMRHANRALRHFDKAVSLRPGFREALLSRGLTRFRLGDHETAARDFGRILALPPSPGRIIDPALARREYAKRRQEFGPDLSFEEALTRGLLPVDREVVLARIYGRVSAYVARGPGFKRPVTVSSLRYEVVAEGSQGVARLVLAELDQGHASWTALLPSGSAELSPPRCRVVVFATRASFVAYLSGLTGDRGSARIARAGYMSAIGQILLISDARLERFLRTIRHEGVHQYLDASLAQLPPWLSEGLADYLACARSSRSGALRCGVHPDRRAALAAALSEKPPPDLSVLLQADRVRFMAAHDPLLARRSSVTARNYALAFAFVHFLMEADGGSRASVVTGILDAVRRGRPLSKAISDAFGDLTPASMQARFLRHAAERLLSED